MATPFVPAPNTIQIEMQYGTWGGKAENVFHVTGNGPITDIAGLCNAAITAFHGWWNTSLKSTQSNEYAIGTITARDIGVEGGEAHVQFFNEMCTHAGLALPDNVTCAVKWNTSRAGRSYRGRSFHVGLPVDFRTKDELTGPAIAALQAAYGALPGVVSAMGWGGFGPTSGTLTVVSKRHNKAWRAVADCTPITGCSITDTHLDSMRRRLSGRGV